MKVIKENSKIKQYQCHECKSIIEISDKEFKIIKEYPPFHLIGLDDFKKDTREKVRACDCPVCGATIKKEYDIYHEFKNRP